MDVLETAWKYEHQLEDKVKHMGKGRYGRVIRMARKPEREEFTKVLQITSLGLIAVGALGFAIYLSWNFLPQYMKELLGL